MRSLSLRAKLFSVLGLLASVGVAISVLGLTTLDSVANQLTLITGNVAPRAIMASDFRGHLTALAELEKNFILEPTQEGKARYRQAMHEIDKKVRDGLTEWRTMASELGMQKLNAFEADYAEYWKLVDKVLALGQRDSVQEAVNLSRAESKKFHDAADAALRQFVQTRTGAGATSRPSTAGQPSEVELAALCRTEMAQLMSLEKEGIPEHDDAVLEEIARSARELGATIEPASFSSSSPPGRTRPSPRRWPSFGNG
jgi:hypothetical protein